MSSEMLPPYSRTDNRYQHVLRAIDEADHTANQQDAGHSLDNQDNVPGSMHEDAVVFEIGDEDAQELSDEEDSAKKRRAATHHQEGEEHEREGLMKDA